MKPIPINLAVEDLLSEAVAKRLLQFVNRDFVTGVVYNRGGNGYLRKTALGWNSAAKSVPFFLLTDLDAEKCATSLLQKWFPSSIHPNMLVRIAVREVEAWLLTDHANFPAFLGISKNLLPEVADAIDDPKSTLLRLASKSSRSEIKKRIVPTQSTTAKQGRDYNACLIEFVVSTWNPEGAAIHSPSLARCLVRLRDYKPTWSS